MYSQLFNSGNTRRLHHVVNETKLFYIYFPDHPCKKMDIVFCSGHWAGTGPAKKQQQQKKLLLLSTASHINVHIYSICVHDKKPILSLLVTMYCSSSVSPSKAKNMEIVGWKSWSSFVWNNGSQIPLLQLRQIDQHQALTAERKTMPTLAIPV